ncbi:MAG TPA: GNAT family N-acetyltransferase [Ilumatobacteraceae bacterium]
MHIVARLELPAGYSARPYVGPADHPEMVEVLNAYRPHAGNPERVSVAQMDATYAHLTGCDVATDIALVEHREGGVVAYMRTSYEDLDTGRDCVVFCPTEPSHLRRDLFDAMVAAQEMHMRPLVDGAAVARFRAHAVHPGPTEPATGEAAWLEGRGYVATEWSASLRRPHLDDIPDLPLPDGVEQRPVTEDQVPEIVAAHLEAFRGEWDFREPTEDDIAEVIDDPLRDISLWKVAWAGDVVVGQVKPFINAEENAERGTLRGYTEYISTHRDWRNRGIAGALLAKSLRELRDRGMTEAVLGVDTNNPGGAFQLYTRLGFELQSYEAIYTRAATDAALPG